MKNLKFKRFLSNSLIVIMGSILFYWISYIHWTIGLFLVAVIALVYISKK